MEEQVGRFGVEGNVADFVDHDESDPADLLEFGIEPPEAVGLGQPGDPCGRRGEPDPVAGVGGGHGQRGREVGLPGAWVRGG